MPPRLHHQAGPDAYLYPGIGDMQFDNVPIGRRVGHQTALGALWRKLDNQGAHVTTIEQTKLLMLAMTRMASTCSRPSCATARPRETAGKNVIPRRALRTAQVCPVQHYDQ